MVSAEYETGLYVWLVIQRRFLAGHRVISRWKISHSAGVYMTKRSADEAAQRFQDESIGWEFKSQRYKRG